MLEKIDKMNDSRRTVIKNRIGMDMTSLEQKRLWTDQVNELPSSGNKSWAGIFFQTTVFLNKQFSSDNQYYQSITVICVKK